MSSKGRGRFRLGLALAGLLAALMAGQAWAQQVVNIYTTKASSINKLYEYSELWYVPLVCELALPWQQSWLPCCHNWTNGLDDLLRRRRQWLCPVEV